MGLLNQYTETNVYSYHSFDGIEKGFVVFGLAELTVINYQDEA